MRNLVSADRPTRDQTTRSTGYPKKICGIACSLGRVSGTARVVRSANDWRHVSVGDIVVCEDIPADCTRYFSLIKGLVSDRGGMLSNAAIVARERQLPAVVGTLIGTKVIRDGQHITVDGGVGWILVNE